MLPPLMEDGRPHWETRLPQEVWPIYEDFRNFLYVVWDHLGLPEPTRAQYEIAHRLQHGVDSVAAAAGYAPDAEQLYDIIRCFRGIGKSYITAAFVIWRLVRNPRDEKVLVVSATGSKSKEFVDQAKGILESLDLCHWLLDGARQNNARRRDMADRFDVAFASNAQSYSVKAAGIGGQITGSRATCIVADDIEIEGNSKTEEARERIFNTTREFDMIGKTEHGRADQYYLGTPQTEESVYNRLVSERGISCFTIPVRYPSADKLTGYRLKDQNENDVDILAHYLHVDHDNGGLDHGALTDPQRFTIEELADEEAKGRAYFALQMMLDTSLSDAERYPLRQQDLVVFATNPTKAPLTIQWGHHSDDKNVIKDIANIGFAGDHLLRPLMVDEEWREYEGKVLFVDPSGRGKDETAWAVVGQLGGYLYVLHVGAHGGDPTEAMYKIARDAKRFDVNVVEVEPNYGQGMWIAAFETILQKVWTEGRAQAISPEDGRRHALDEAVGCTIQEAEWARGMKEERIIDVLEPVMTQHRLILNEDTARRDVDAARREQASRVYSLMFQLTHLARERDALKHDDRIDALAGAVKHFQDAVSIDHKKARDAQLEHERDEMIEDFLEMFEDGGSISSLGLSRKRGKRRADGSRSEVTSVKV